MRYIVTNKDHKFLVEDQLQQIHTSCNVLLEPCGKNTLPAIMYATGKIHEKDSDAKILVLSSDQLIEEMDVYQYAIMAGAYLAENYIVTFGIVPTTPHTGYGYIQKGLALADGYKVSAFKEKPDMETAKNILLRDIYGTPGYFVSRPKSFSRSAAKQHRILQRHSHMMLRGHTFSRRRYPSITDFWRRQKMWQLFPCP